MKILFIINPTAGKGRGKEVGERIQLFMRDRDVNYKIAFTGKPREAETIAKHSVMEGYDRIVAVGGDGTIYEVANGIAGCDVVMGIIPSGTGNDLARTLGIPLNIEEALAVIIDGAEKAIDLGCVNGRRFLNVTSIGLDAEIVREAENLKKYFSGTSAYVAGVLKALLHFKRKKVTLILDGKEQEKNVMLVAIANGKYYGGGMKIAPTADIEDGTFEVCIVNEISKLKILRLFPTIFSGTHIHVREVELLRAKTVKITSKEELIINIDGDIAGVTPVNIEMMEKGLRFIVPRSQVVVNTTVLEEIC